MPYNQLQGYVPPTDQNETEDGESSPNITHGTRLWALISLILSAVGVILVVVPVIGIFFGLFGVGFAIFSRKKNGYFYTGAVAGIIVGTIAAVSCAFFIVFNAMTDAGLIVNIFDALVLS